MDKHGYFPTGLLTALTTFLDKKSLKYTVIDKRVKPEVKEANLFFKLPQKPYKDQIDATIQAMASERGIIVAPTGSGKSMIIKLILATKQCKALVIVPTVELKRQLLSDLVTFFVNGDELVGPLVNKTNKKLITVENIDQLADPKVKIDADCLIIDEFHRSASKTYQKLNKSQWHGIYYRFGLTATPFRSKTEEKLLLASILEDVIYQIDYQDAVSKGYIVSANAYFVDLPKTKLIGNLKNFESVYSQVMASEERMKAVLSFIKHAVDTNTSTLVLVKRIEHGEAIQAAASDMNIDIPFAQGVNDSNADIITKFSAGEMPILIGTVGVLGEGIDTKACEYVILAGGGKSRNQFHQNIGRSFRKFNKNNVDKESAKVILFRDTSHKWMLDHFNTCVKYLKQDFGITPIKLNLQKEPNV